MTTISSQTATQLLAAQTAAQSSTAATSQSASSSTSSASSSSTAPASTTPSSSAPSAADIAAAKAAAANSASYSFSDVASNARIVIDAGAAQLGQPIGNSTTASQISSIFGNMDRRSLYAVASNQGGQFSQAEQNAASYTMTLQESAAIGNVTSGSAADSAKGFSNGIDFLNSVSPEEKQSGKWALEMASATTSYNDLADDANLPEETGSGTNPLVQVLIKAMKAGQANAATDTSIGNGGFLQDLLNEPWAKGFESQIQAAYAATIPQGALINTSA